MIAAAVAAVVVLVVGAVFLLGGDDDGEVEIAAPAGTVLLEPIGSEGDDPFSDSVAPAPAGSLLDYADKGAPDTGEDGEIDTSEGAAGYQTADGSVPGVYGGTLNEAACDKEQLVDFLAAETDKAEAFAAVLEIDPADIGDYVEDLTPANLGADTRVVNHGFADGEAVPRESVLQRGTAVLVDDRGVPRVNCYCGNPLREPAPDPGGETFEGPMWESFDTREVLLVERSSEVIESFELVDYTTGERFARPAGTAGDADLGATRDDLADDGPIDFDTVYETELNEVRTEARYTFDAPDSAIFTLRISNDPASNGSVAADLTANGEGFEFFRTPAGGTEEVTITLDHDGGAEFVLEFTEGFAAFEFEVTLDSQDDAGEGVDAGDEFSSGLEIDPTTEVSGSLAGQDAGDVYLVDVVPGAELVFDVSVPADSGRGAFALRLGDDDLEFFRVGGGGSEQYRLLLSHEDSGQLQISVTEGPVEYQLSMGFVPQEDAGQPGDAPAELADARTLESLEAIPGQVGGRDRGDYYLFTTPGPALTIEVTNAATSADRIAVEVLDATGSGVAFFRVNAGATISESFQAAPGEQYRLRFFESSGTSEYTASISGVTPQ